MNTKIYVNNEKFIAGISLKDSREPEQNNMALHVCENIDQVVENRQKLAASLNCGLETFVCANQTHSANFHRVTLDDKGRGADTIDNAIADTDALYTYESDLLLCSFTADCVPVIFFNEQTGLIGVIHSGWQGTVKEITWKLFEHLKQVEQCNIQDIHVQLGPALSQEKFEVDEDVYVQFKKLGYADDFIYYNDETCKYHIDNQLTVKKQCELAGISSTQITLDQTCTFMSPNGFSYRQDKKSGRHMSFIMKKGAYDRA
ncbi:peptidoglycan editing factor PgeF [Psychrobacillus lasiicapitis]|uniref:Purine nucleoside phosphorylase n=1 Tax=Psychrobacillus lasiicapitis TaxID=1636719 RepID=A0A544SU55_9BACI|nr:peptidoglycan editing factor PgeF [Psychrobacillus lasiicapitis]TQR08668.1 peptidoglycan editing factor PgeF [Psychrobacillus lasiicapitis]